MVDLDVCGGGRKQRWWWVEKLCLVFGKRFGLDRLVVR